MKEPHMRCLAPLIACAALVACAGPSATPDYDARFGDAVREARARMTLNPNPPTAATAAGIDGRAAHEAQERYLESYKAPPPVVNVINIGAGRGGQ
jgi:hypothetical protein